MRLLCCAIIACLLFSIAFATEVSGPVSGIWDLGGSPYEVVDSIYVESGTSLVIESGVDVLFQGHYPLFVYGSLQALGSEQDSILFDAVDTDSGWLGIRFYDNTTQPDSSILDYCILQHGKSSSRNAAGELKNGGVIYCSNASNLRISNGLITENQTGDITGQSGLVGDPGTPGEDVETGHGGAIFLESSDVLIVSNVFKANQTGNATGGKGGDGVDVTASGPGGGNLLGGDGGMGGSSETGTGGTIYCINSSPQILMNFIYENGTGDATGGEGGEGGQANSSYYGGYNVYGGEGGAGGEALSGYGAAIYCTSGESFLTDNVFTHNSTGNAVGGLGGSGGAARINNSLSSNIAGNGGNGGVGTAGSGGSIYCINNHSSILHNLYYSNSIGEGYGGNGGYGGSAFQGGAFGGPAGDGGDGGDGCGGIGSGFTFENCISSVNNNTISLNEIGQGYAGTGGSFGFGFPIGEAGNAGNSYNGHHVLYFEDCDIQITNSIIYNNAGIPIVFGSPTINYTCIEYGYAGIGILNEDPIFVDPENGDFHLQSTVGSYHGGAWLPDENYSPCIDTGDPESPYENEPSPNGNRVNMGVYGNTAEASLTYVNSIKGDPPEIPLSFIIIGVFPNPFNSNTTITFDLPVASEVKLEVFDIKGRLVSGRHKIDSYAAGTHSITFGGSGLFSGIYFYQLQAGEFTAIGKMVLLK